MNSVFHELHDKVLLAGQAVALLIRPSSRVWKEKFHWNRWCKSSFPPVAELPIKAVAVEGVVGHHGAAPGIGLFGRCWGWIRLGIARSGEGYGWQGRLLMLTDAWGRSAFWRGRWRSRWAKENKGNIPPCFTSKWSDWRTWMVRGAGAGEASVWALLHPVLLSSLPFFQGLMRFFFTLTEIIEFGINLIQLLPFLI